jgi:hypothetical protein
MDDYSHLKKEHDSEEKGLINAEGTGHEGQALLARMKHISELISNVRILNQFLIYYYIGSYHFLEKRVYLPRLLLGSLRYPFVLHS